MILDDIKTGIDEMLLEIKALRAEVEGLKAKGTPAATGKNEDLMTAAEAAEFLGFTMGTLYYKAARGEVPSRKAAGNRRVYFKSDLIAMLQSGETNPRRKAKADAAAAINRNL